MEFLIYLLKVNIAIALFYGLYRLFFQKDTFFQWKRIFMLGLIFLSLIYPFASLPNLFPISGNELFSNEAISGGLSYWVHNLSEITIYSDIQNEQTTWSLFRILLAVYLIGAACIFVRLLIQFTSLLVLIFQSLETKVYKSQKIHVNKKITMPFSFFNWILMDPDLHTESDLDEIISHEATHVQQMHSIDVLLSELFCIFCWFNPFVWLLKREIRMNLEYLADRSVIASGFDSKHYQFNLLRLCHHKAIAKLSNNFNESPLKNRITMMNKKETSLWNIAKYALFLPLALSLTLMNGYSESNAANKIEIEALNEPLPAKAPIEAVTTEDSDEDKKIHDRVEVLPVFPGGDTALIKYLSDNIDYPKDVVAKGIQGMVVLRFVIAPDGSIDDIEVIRSLDPILDKEAIRVVEKMPKWEPGRQENKPVYVFYNLPIRFRLAEESK